MVFDEAFTVDRDMTLANGSPPWPTRRRGRVAPIYFRPAVLEEFWRFSRKEPDGHPPFYALLGVAGWRLVRGWLDPAHVLSLRPDGPDRGDVGVALPVPGEPVRPARGRTAATAWWLAPRTFAHAHYAHYDMPVTCLWVLAQLAFVKSLRSSGWVVAFGVLLGLAAGTKFTGWFAVVPRSAGGRSSRAARWPCGSSGTSASMARPASTVPPPPAARRPAGDAGPAVGIPLAALTLYAIQPPWWSSPLVGPPRFLVSNLTREDSVPVTSLYLGTVYRFACPGITRSS